MEEVEEGLDPEGVWVARGASARGAGVRAGDVVIDFCSQIA